MQSARRFFSFLSGIALYTSAMVASNLLTTITLPRSWVLVSGRSDTMIAQAWKAGLLALPLVVLAAIWVNITLRARQRSRKHVVAWLFGGLVTGWLGWLMYGFVVFAVQTGERTWPVASMLFSSHLPPLWGLMNTVGIFLGAVIGLWTVPERVSTRQRRVAVAATSASAPNAGTAPAPSRGPRIPRLSNWRKPAAPSVEAASGKAREKALSQP
ncbi:hypothetical protein PFX98_14615 [Paucibacter sediminis]|uniref:Uncharacterized protein n=1 Tax=Paucibacter sediminis TaxID=3019553 RepID=A0AA95NIG5_9BURK|nr:hypothetical protein [Paucibacter sp. S2-9]WIT10166.1 hypothetical protein PFX98_14615 [Paucibacter sp. S2-9]